MLESPPEQADDLPQPIPRRYYMPGEALVPADVTAPDTDAADSSAFRARGGRWRYVAAFGLYVVLGALLATAGASAASLLTSYRSHDPVSYAGGSPSADRSARTWTSTVQPWNGQIPVGTPSPTPARASLLGPSPEATATPAAAAGLEPSPLARPDATPTPTATPTPVPTPKPTPTPTPTPTATPTPSPTPTPTPKP